MSEKTIYDFFRKAGMTAEGACAMIGNMQAESSLIANIAQRGMTNLTDEQYTKRFDTDPDRCYKDGVGYGLCQWTYWTRKQGLKFYADRVQGSVGEEKVQLGYCLEELKSAEYKTLFAKLCTTHDLYSAASDICTQFERPAFNNISTRYGFAQKAFERLVQAEEIQTTPDFPPDPSIMMLQTILNYNCYSCDVTGYKDANFLSKLREFVTDLGG